MAALKDNINDISDNTEHLIKDYLKLFAINQTEKIALLFGVLSSVFIISIFLFLVIIFCSIALANYLNTLFEYNYLGYVIVAGVYQLSAIVLVLKAINTRTPLLTNLFVKLLGFVLNLDADRSKNIKDLKREKEFVNQKIETDKAKIKSNYQMIRFGFLESILKELFGLFKPNKTAKNTDDIHDTNTEEQVSEDETPST